SGSNDVLKKMNRHYTAEKYLQACNLLKGAFPNGNITTDIIVGFPTETEADFNQSVELAKKAGFGFIHVFPYSKRDGTVASKMPDMDKKIKETRAKILMGVRDELKSQFIAQNLGSTLTVLTEDKEEDLRVGYTENYVKVYLEEDVPENTLVKVKLITPFKDGVKAIII
ncbi:MAG: radical SAM protein, partial [Clostridia bacterium]|nr:radical SAM protein [Clostridia bacterium]